MRKREIIKKLKRIYKIKTKSLGVYDFEVITDNKSYFVKIINITNNYQVTINSKIIWDLKKGTINGIRFKAVSSNLISLKEFNKLENKVVIFTSKPYKVLKVLNESDLLDISNEKTVNDIFITSKIEDLIEYIK